MSALTRRGSSHGKSARTTTATPDALEAARFAAAVADTESRTAVSCSSSSYTREEFTYMLTVTPSDAGWRVKLGHRVLLDLSSVGASSVDAAALVTMTTEARTLATLLPTRSLYAPTDLARDFVVSVASASALIAGKMSLFVYVSPRTILTNRTLAALSPTLINRTWF